MTTSATTGLPAFDFTAQLRTYLDNLTPGTPDNTGPTNRTGHTQNTGKTAAVGTGASAPTDGPGEVAHPGAMPTRGIVLATALASLFTMMPPPNSDDDTEVMLASIESKMKQTNDKVGEQEIGMDQNRKRNAIAAKRSAIEEANKHMDEATTAHKHMSTWEKVKLAFTYIGAVLTIAAGILSLLTAPFSGGLGALAGGLLIASGVMMLMMAIDQTMSSVPGKDGQPGKGFIAMTADSITKDMYPNDPDKQKAEAAKWTMGLNCALMGASIVCGILGAVVNPAGAIDEVMELPTMVEDVEELASGAAQISTTVEETASTSVEVASTAEQTASTVEETASTSAEVASTAEQTTSTAGEGGSVVGDGTEVASEETEVADVAEVAEDSESVSENLDAEFDKTTDSAGETRYVSPKTAQYIGQDGAAMGKTIIRVGETVNGAANAGSDAAPLAYGYIASSQTAQATTSRGQAKQYAAVDKMLDGALDALMARIKQDGERFASVIGNLTDAVKDHSSSMSHVKFRG